MKDYENLYEEGSASWKLLEAGNKLANQPTGLDERANATDRQTIALYRVGAELASSFEDISRVIGYVAEEIRDKT